MTDAAAPVLLARGVAKAYREGFARDRDPEKLRKKLSYKKAADKILVKLTPDGSMGRRCFLNFIW
jgi:hypothetical protein